jgi:ribose 5-phosphate isomerase RpiB
MKAIWRGVRCAVVDDDGDGVLLDLIASDGGTTRTYVPYSDSALVVDPTDGEWAASHNDSSALSACLGRASVTPVES